MNAVAVFAAHREASRLFSMADEGFSIILCACGAEFESGTAHCEHLIAELAATGFAVVPVTRITDVLGLVMPKVLSGPGYEAGREALNRLAEYGGAGADTSDCWVNHGCDGTACDLMHTTPATGPRQ